MFLRHYYTQSEKDCQALAGSRRGLFVLEYAKPSFTSARITIVISVGSVSFRDWFITVAAFRTVIMLGEIAGIAIVHKVVAFKFRATVFAFFNHTVYLTLSS